MKKLLELIQSLQNELITKLDSKEPTMTLSKIAGAVLPGDTESPEYRKIVQIVAKFKETSRQYKTHTSKIVLEKNLALNVIKQLGGYFFLRTFYSNESVYLPVSKKTKKIIETPFFAIGAMATTFFVLLLCILIFNTIGVSSPTQTKLAIIICSTISLASVGHFLYRKYMIVYLNALYKNNPQNIFLAHVSSGAKEKSKKNNQVLFQTCINLDEKYTSWYSQVLKSLLSLEKKEFSMVGWLWQFTQQGTYIDLSTRKLTLSKNQLVIPFAETSTAFIFYFPEQDVKDFYRKEILEYTPNEDYVHRCFMSYAEKLFLPTIS